MMPQSSPNAGARPDDLLILLPVFNDWSALQLLLGRLDAMLDEHGLAARVLVVDDGSLATAEEALWLSQFSAIAQISVLRLRRNLGHQRAIAVGLAYVEERLPAQTIVVMDSDGEDNPDDIPRLLDRCRTEHPQKIVFAERVKRSESWTFRVLYVIYKFLYRLLTGQRVRVGNFSVIPRCRLTSLVAVSELWNHYAAAVFKSRQPYCTEPTCRAKRLAGTSRMNFVSLVIHGLSAISVHADVVGVRLLIATSAVILVALAGLAATVAIRLCTTLAIPGWATSAAGLLLIVLLQAVMFSIVFCFIILNNRQGTTVLPLRDYKYFVAACTTLYPEGARQESNHEALAGAP